MNNILQIIENIQTKIETLANRRNAPDERKTHVIGKDILDNIEKLKKEIEKQPYEILREIGRIQDQYQELKKKQKHLTKKAICNLAVPFRNKYGLTDIETLRIIRNEMTISEIAKILENRKEI